MKKRPVRQTDRRKTGLKKFAGLPIWAKWAAAHFGADYDEQAAKFVNLWWDNLQSSAASPSCPARIRRLFDDPVAVRIADAFAKGDGSFFRLIALYVEREYDPVNKTLAWLSEQALTFENHPPRFTARQAFDEFQADTGSLITLTAFRRLAKHCFPNHKFFLPDENRGWHKGKRRKRAAEK